MLVSKDQYQLEVQLKKICLSEPSLCTVKLREGSLTALVDTADGVIQSHPPPPGYSESLQLRVTGATCHVSPTLATSV